MHALFFFHPLLQASPQKAEVRYHNQFSETCRAPGRDEGWLKVEKQQWLLLAMLQRGLALQDEEKCLTCIHCRKQLWGSPSGSNGVWRVPLETLWNSFLLTLGCIFIPFCCSFLVDNDGNASA